MSNIEIFNKGTDDRGRKYLALDDFDGDIMCLSIHPNKESAYSKGIMIESSGFLVKPRDINKLARYLKEFAKENNLPGSSRKSPGSSTG